ncbi:putative clathrin assembly protein [Raphanus sativus]|uniref:Clathrin assembly protein At1g25240 n=1 Tax=Raphanus sativus TaxID=3726 RepID=A0A6J0P122_RAPSA|nr:putative clathrin assembly protein At1g25240 [Raphanus sativus]KAJ4894659.1 putative clathrin assembly protein [Raphanus sativus]
MMKLWKRASGALKDRKSLFSISFSRTTSFRNPDLDSAIIHATSHDDSSVDYHNAHRVYKWIRSSPANLKPLVHSLSSRVNRTRSWIVALKALMLVHGVLCCKVPSLHEIRRLPFDLSDFSDGHSRPSKTWGFNALIRAYFSFLDQYSFFLSDQIRSRNRKPQVDSVNQELESIEKLQSLLHTLLQIRPMADNMKKTLILEAMDCVVIEIFDIYGRICSGIAKLLIKISPAAGKAEAMMALKILKKATSQGEDLALYFEFCKEFGVSNAHEVPKFIRIPQENIEAMEKAIKGVKEKEEDHEGEVVEEKNIILAERPKFQTIITDQWEVFEDEYCFICKDIKETDQPRNYNVDPSLLPLIAIDEPVCLTHTLPDLITF